MSKFKTMMMLGMASLVLGACGEAGVTEDPENELDTTEIVDTSTTNENAEDKEAGLEDLDQSIQDELANLDSDEEVNWDNINLNKRQFREYIESLSLQTEDPEEDEESTLEVVSSTMLDDNTVEIIINNTDTSEMSDFTNQFFAIMMDTFSRQLYLHSDFSDGNSQPTIIIKDESGDVISEQTDFIEMEENE